MEAVFSGGADRRLVARAQELQNVVHHVPDRFRPRVETMGSSLAIEASGMTAGAGAALAMMSALRRRAPAPKLHAALRVRSIDPSSVNAACVAATLALHNSVGEWDAAVSCFEHSMFTSSASLARHPAVGAAAVHALAATGAWVRALQVLDMACGASGRFPQRGDGTAAIGGQHGDGRAVTHRRLDGQAAWLSSVLDALPGDWDVAVRLHTCSAAAVGLPEQSRSSLAQKLAARLIAQGAGDERIHRALSTMAQGGRSAASPAVAVAESWAGLVGTEDLRGIMRSDRRERILSQVEAHGDWQSALVLLDAANSGGVVPQAISVGVCSRLVVTLVKSGKPQLAKRALRRMMDAGIEGRSLAGALRAMLTHSTNRAAAVAWQQVLESHGIPLDSNSRDRLIVLSARDDEWSTALSLVLDATQSANDQTAVTSARHPSSANSRQPSLSAVAHDEVQFAMGRCRVDWRTCVALYQRVSESGVRPSEVAFKSTVSSCLDQGADDAAQAVLVATIRLGVGR
jgi:hypothetical protein